MTGMGELADKDVKTDTINVLHMFRKAEESMNIIRDKAEDIKRPKWNLPGIKNTTSEIKTHLMGLTDD